MLQMGRSDTKQKEKIQKILSCLHISLTYSTCQIISILGAYQN